MMELLIIHQLRSVRTGSSIGSDTHRAAVAVARAAVDVVAREKAVDVLTINSGSTETRVKRAPNTNT